MARSIAVIHRSAALSWGYTAYNFGLWGLEVAGHIFLVMFRGSRGSRAPYIGFTSVHTCAIRIGAVFMAVLLRMWRLTSVYQRFNNGTIRFYSGYNVLREVRSVLLQLLGVITVIQRL